MMRRPGAGTRGAVIGGLEAALAVAAVLLSLGMVVWRQTRALEALAELDAVQSRRAVLAAEKVDLERRIQTLESRGWVLPQAERRLGLRTPQADEIVIRPGVTS